MRKLLLLFLTILFMLCVAESRAQSEGSWRVKHLVVDSLTIHLDTMSIVPQSFQIQDVKRNQYRLDPLTATLTLLDSTLLGQRIFLQYQVFAFDLSQPVAHKTPLNIEPRRSQHQIAEYPITSVYEVLNDHELYTNGAISRGVSVADLGKIVG